MSVQILRFRLPQACLDPATSPLVRFVGLDRRGQVVRHGEMPLLSLPQAFAGARFEAVLHPEDSRLAAVQLPPVAANRLHDAVLGAVEPMLLDPLETQVIAHGIRSADGRVLVAWAPRARLSALLTRYADLGLSLQALYPAALNLPIPPEGLAMDRVDDTLLLRDAEGQGYEVVLDPLAAQPLDDALGQLAHWPVFRDAATLHLHQGSTDPDWRFEGKQLVRHNAEQSWNAAPGLNLLLPDLLPQRGLSTLARKNLGWLAATLALLVLGLNLSAHRLDAEVQTLRTRMTQQVRQAYPQLPIVVDPLKQAQQQHAALLGQTGLSSDADFIPLSLATAELFPEFGNQVRRLHYQDGALTLELAPAADAPTLGEARGDGNAAPTSLTEAQQQRAKSLNLMVEADGTTWRIRSSQTASATSQR